MANLQELIRFDFLIGIRHGEMLMRIPDDIMVSMRTLRKITINYGRLHGYLVHHHKCVQAGYAVDKW